MTKYRVYFEATTSVTVEVEVNDTDVETHGDAHSAAIDKAYDSLPGDICAQCAGWGQKWSRDQGEYEIAKERRQIDDKWVDVEVEPELIND